MSLLDAIGRGLDKLLPNGVPLIQPIGDAIGGKIYDYIHPQPLAPAEKTPTTNPNVLGTAVKFQPTTTPTTTPTPIVNPAASSEVIPNNVPTYGRTKKAESAIKTNPDKYQQLISWLDTIGANDLEKNLAVDIAAQESMINPQSPSPGPTSTSRGLYMFNNGTWGNYQKGIGNTGVSQDNGLDQLNAFLYAIRHGITGQGLSRWNASKPVWGPSYTPEELSNFKP
jgi:hypothetical protein